MPVPNIPSLKPGVSNGELLQVAINGANIGYKARIPSPTQAGVETTVRYLDQHRQLWNPIYTALMTQIGTIVARHNSWTNPLARFKRGLVEYGNGIEEYQTGLIRAKAYDPNRSFGEKMAFGTHRVPIDVSFHEKNRMDVYPVSVERAVIKSAFLGEGDMSGLISDIMAAPSESDKWDEFLLMSRLFTEYERRGGFYHAHVPDISAQDVTERDVKLALRKMRATAGNLKFRSPYYNAAHFPIAAKPDNLVMFITPEANAALDVEGLAALFNVSYAEVPYHIIEVPAEYFPQGGCQAILVDSDFFVVADTLLENLNFQDPTEPSQENIFLHHHEIISCSRFVPAIMFWTGGETERVIAKDPVTAITAIKAYGEGAKGVQGQDMVRGGNYQLEATCTGGGTDPDINWTARGTDTRTQVSQAGVLSIGPRELGPITVAAEADGARLEAEFTGIGGDAFPEWPATKSELKGIDVLGRRVAKFAEATKEYTVTRSRKALLAEDGAESQVYPVGINVFATAISIAKGEAGFVVKLTIAGLDGHDYGEYTVNVV